MLSKEVMSHKCHSAISRIIPPEIIIMATHAWTNGPEKMTIFRKPSLDDLALHIHQFSNGSWSAVQVRFKWLFFSFIGDLLALLI